MDTPHPDTGLTPRQVEVLQESWKGPSQNVEETGVEVLMRLFTAHPEYMKYFSNFSDVPLDQLRTFARFRRHGLNVARSLDQAIGELNDVPKLVDRFTALGVTHGGRKISEQAFQDLKLVVVNLMKEAVKVDDFGAQAWSQLFDAAYKIMFAAMRTMT